MDPSFTASAWQSLLKLGLVDDEYPLAHSSVQLPNGWSGVNSAIGGFSSILARQDYDELLLPTVSTSGVFQSVPPALQSDVTSHVLTITHTGVHKLDSPFYLSSRPDLIIPQVVQVSARSYRDLPVRLMQRGFRYVRAESALDVSLVTDTEYSALDAEAVFATEAEYEAELQSIVRSFDQFAANQLKLSTVHAQAGAARAIFAVLPDGSLLEIARVWAFGSALAEAIGFRVLQTTNTAEPPFICAFNTTSRLFAAVVAAHCRPGRVTLPIHTTRAAGVSYGVDTAAIRRIRIDLERRPFGEERFEKCVREVPAGSSQAAPSAPAR
jgi:hypothetical protein